jgi:hypothetical protein
MLRPFLYYLWAALIYSAIFYVATAFAYLCYTPTEDDKLLNQGACRDFFSL